MKLIVCIKQVPDTTEIKIDPVTNTLVREGVESILNPFDAYAIEEAVRLKEQHGGNITAICMGPPQAEATLREAVSLGVDDIILLSDRKFAGADTWATSYTLAAAIRKLEGADLILTGQQAIDGDTAQVGPGIAAHLNIPQTCFVRKIEEVSSCNITLQRLMEDGSDRIRIKLPAVISVVKEINTPRLPSLRGKRNAKSVELKVWNADDLGLDEKDIGLNGSPTQVLNIFTPKHEKLTQKFEGDSDEAVELIVKSLHDLTKGT
ncbi:MAG TPA: electron transfer flavoprotein subunit beta/FixA family protein [Candidatus Cloacimonadota bacterium]|jgi:electron transfer flavoprotein beta subunit|nr:electron transfer flavoprotein subunit beta/FixA family protein [Candidatus Cloacimonadota bacterium]HOR57931.1 electron transfer flavoprotein subunit beta/FixA family protein [Candidatus Cloacimonadota bacterium]HPB08366.1 electron transfer flavoprotein subunit beta/FixA family protein [Candidatus Cloacimonadota bacterium]HPL23010.1 electron transfer flavoprotein subunit beta/FixA family protein [Candidatus Cloacimonadota bacterium]HQP17439.1 electron transfer flavoprotein subunit beta/FixA